MAETNVTSQSSTGTSHHPARGSDQIPEACQELLEQAKDYARERPEMAAMWCFGLGFILGWKMKPW